MGDIQIAYDLLVIMIGLAALSIAVFWAFKTGESDLRDFCILYASYTLVLIVLVIRINPLARNVLGRRCRRGRPRNFDWTYIAMNLSQIDLSVGWLGTARLIGDL